MNTIEFQDVIIIDEISFTEEVVAARTISQRGVTLIARFKFLLKKSNW